VDSEMTPHEGHDPGLVPAQQGSEPPWDTRDPWDRTAQPGQSQDAPATPPPASGYPVPGQAQPGYPAQQGGQAGSPYGGGQYGSQPGYADPGGPQQNPYAGGQPGYASPAAPAGGSPDYRYQGAQQGYPSQGYQPEAGQQGYPSQGYQPEAGQQGYPSQGYQPGGPQGYQQPQGPAAPGSPYQQGAGQQAYQGTPPYPGASDYRGTQSYQESPDYQATQAYQGASYPGAQDYSGTMVQPGYPAPPGAAWPAQGTGAPQRKRSRGLLLGITALVAAIIAGGVTGLVLILNKHESPTAMALQAGQGIASSKAIALSGTYDRAPADLTLTKAGTVAGTYSEGPFAVTRITIDGVTYLKAPSGFWNLQANVDPTGAQQAGGAWAKTPAALVTSFSPLLPSALSRTLEHVGSHISSSNTTLDGTSAVKLTDAGTVYYITTAQPNRLLSVDGSLDGTGYSLSVKELTASSDGSAYTTMQGYVQQLGGAIDPAADLTTQGNIAFNSNCNDDTACNVSINVQVKDPSSSTVLVKMTANFAGSQNGTPFGSCTDTIPANTAQSSSAVTVTPSCQLGGSTWSGWFDSHTSNFTLWCNAKFVATVNSASDVANLQSILTQQEHS
jgi:hypothetical protein